FLLRGLTAVTDGITLKGDFQVDPLSGLRWFFGFEGRLTRGDRWLVVYSALLASLVAFLLSVLLSGWRHGNGIQTWPVIALAGAAFFAERQSVRLSPRAEVSVSFLPIVLAAVIYGPLAAICVSVASLLPSFQYPYARWLTWTSTRSIAAGCAGVAAYALDGSEPHQFGR